MKKNIIATSLLCSFFIESIYASAMPNQDLENRIRSNDGNLGINLQFTPGNFFASNSRHTPWLFKCSTVE